MAGIGDYIHLRNSDYQRYGTTYRGPSNYSGASAIFEAQRNKMIREINSSNNDNVLGLESYLNGLLYGTEESAAKYYEEGFAQYRDAIEQIFNEKYGQFDFNVSQGLNVYQKIKNISTSKSSRKTLDRSQLEQYLKQIVLMINGNIGLKQGTDINDIMRVKAELEAYLDSHSEGMMIRKADNMNLINDINRVLAYQSFPRPLAIGDIGEIFLAAADAKANNRAEKIGNDLIEEMKKHIVGGQGSKATIQGDKFDDKYVDLSKVFSSSNWQKIDENNSWQLSTESQDKVDVYFDWHGNTLAISAKNYNLTDYEREIHILSGSNLLYLIANEDDLFVNHWLNLISTSDRDSGNNTSALLQAAHTAMKITILIKALTGEKLGRNSAADTFVLNDRHRKHIYVFTMSKLANNAIQQLNNVTFGGYPDLLHHEYEGDDPSQELAMVRITNLLKSVYNCKISVALPQTVFF